MMELTGTIQKVQYPPSRQNVVLLLVCCALAVACGDGAVVREGGTPIFRQPDLPPTLEERFDEVWCETATRHKENLCCRSGGRYGSPIVGTVNRAPPPITREEYERWNFPEELPLPVTEFEVITYRDYPTWRYFVDVPRSARFRMTISANEEMPVEVLVYPQSQYGKVHYGWLVGNLDGAVITIGRACSVPKFLLDPIVHINPIDEPFTFEFPVEEGGMYFIEFFQTTQERESVLISAELIVEEGEQSEILDSTMEETQP